MKLLRELFLDELADMYRRRSAASSRRLPKLVKGATCPKLKDALLAHLKQTEGHVTKLEQIFGLFGEKAKAKTCEATVGILRRRRRTGGGLQKDLPR